MSYIQIVMEYKFLRATYSVLLPIQIKATGTRLNCAVIQRGDTVRGHKTGTLGNAARWILET